MTSALQVASRRGWRDPLPLPRVEHLWRAPETVVVVTVWLLLVAQQLAISLSRPKMYVPLTTGGQEVPAWAATVTTATNAGVVLLAVVVVAWRLRELPWHQAGTLLLALAPWVLVVARSLALGRPPSALALVYPAIVVALWAVRPRLAVVEVLGYLTVVTATISVALGIWVPWAGRYVRAEGADLEKPIGPFGILAGMMLSGNDLGLVLAVGVAAVLTIRLAAVRWPGLAVTLVAVGWSASRTAAVAVAAVLAALVTVRLVRRWGARSVRGVVAGGLGALVAVMVALPLLVSAPTAFSNRGRLWAFATERFAHEPVLGWGADVFKELALTDANLGGHASHAHNLAAQVLISGGLVLAVAMVALLGRAIVRAVREAAYGWDWSTLFLTAFLVCATVEVPLVFTDRIRQFPYVAVPLLVLVLAQPAAAAARSAARSSAP